MMYNKINYLLLINNLGNKLDNNYSCFNKFFDGKISQMKSCNIKKKLERFTKYDNDSNNKNYGERTRSQGLL